MWRIDRLSSPVMWGMQKSTKIEKLVNRNSSERQSRRFDR